MKNDLALNAFGALSQETRLQVLRLLLERKNGLSVGEINAHFDIAPATLSFHLKTLRDAQLVNATRNGRSIMYRAQPQTLNQLSGFLAA